MCQVLCDIDEGAFELLCIHCRYNSEMQRNGPRNIRIHHRRKHDQYWQGRQIRHPQLNWRLSEVLDITGALLISLYQAFERQPWASLSGESKREPDRDAAHLISIFVNLKPRAVQLLLLYKYITQLPLKIWNSIGLIDCFRFIIAPVCLWYLHQAVSSNVLPPYSLLNRQSHLLVGLINILQVHKANG